MSRSAGLSVLHSNFETRIAAPLDSRMLVDALADLHATATWQSGDGSYYAYKGMLVCVCNDTEENNGVYRLAALPYTTSSNWVKIGSGTGTALPISHQSFARPYFEAATHLVVQAAHELDFSDTVTIIDTANVVADRAKVIAYNGAVLMACPETGFGGNFSGQPVRVDLSAITEPCILRYKWVSAAGDSDWYVTFFPSNGEAYVDVNFGQNETLTELTGADVTIAPWTQSKWSASGTCTLTATGWAGSGHQVAYVLITLAAGATPSIIGTEEVAEDDALSAAGVYECYIKNVDGKKYFRVISFTEVAS